MVKFREWLIESESVLKIDHYQTTEKTQYGICPAVSVNAYIDGQHVGDLYLVQDNDEWVVYGVNVRPKYQRRGIATSLYDYAEKLLGVRLKPSSSQTDNGKAFWQARLQNRPEPTI